LVLAVAAAADGTVWCGTYRSGIWRVSHTEARRFPYENAAVPDTIFSSITCDAHGNVWAGTPHGLVHFDGQQWRVFDKANSGLPSNNVRAVAIGDNGDVWAATASGIARYSPPALTL
jgi:ligand-binding sensor domain-containing protein